MRKKLTFFFNYWTQEINSISNSFFFLYIYNYPENDGNKPMILSNVLTPGIVPEKNKKRQLFVNLGDRQVTLSSSGKSDLTVKNK